MLSTISWQQYLAALVIITVVYYLYVALRYYQLEIANFFNTKKDFSNAISSFHCQSIEVIGHAKADLVSEFHDDSTLTYAEVLPDREEITPVAESSDVSGAETDGTFVNQLEEDAGKLIDAYKNNKDKDGFIGLLNVLISSYTRLEGAEDLGPIKSWIVEHANDKLQFKISKTDLA